MADKVARQLCLHAVRARAGHAARTHRSAAWPGRVRYVAKVLSVDEVVDPRDSRRCAWSARGFRGRGRGKGMGCRASRPTIESHVGHQAFIAGKRGALRAHARSQNAGSSVRESGNVAGSVQRRRPRRFPKCQGPYQAHAPFGPNCAIADVKADSALVMCSTQDIYNLRTGLARMLEPAQQKRYGSGTTKVQAPTAIVVTTMWLRPL